MNFELFDKSKFDNSLVKRDFIKLYQQQKDEV